MLSGAALRKTGTGWEFASEAALEDFVWANLTQLLGLTPVKRQYLVKGQFCDILALGENKQLVVLELKNTEDRYIIQQLTRYYDALLEEKPFRDEVNYRQPVSLAAITPIFHRDNLIDVKYHTLSFQLLQFSVTQECKKFYFELNNINSAQSSQLEIPYTDINLREIGENIPEPPRLLLDWLGSCTASEQERILKIRQQILSFDQGMQEITELRNIKYGRGKTKLCAEFSLEKKSKKIVCFLWLNLPNRRKPATGRMQVHTDWSFYSQISHVPEGFYNARKHRTFLLREGNEWVYDDLDVLVNEALENWQNRL